MNLIISNIVQCGKWDVKAKEAHIHSAEDRQGQNIEHWDKNVLFIVQLLKKFFGFIFI